MYDSKIVVGYRLLLMIIIIQTTDEHQINNTTQNKNEEHNNETNIPKERKLVFQAAFFTLS